MSTPHSPLIRSGSQCAILVGGKGTRLGNITATCPKPLLDVAGQPFLSRLIELISVQGIDEILLLAGHLGETVRELYDKKTVNGAHITVLIEDEPRGTGGALLTAKEYLADEFLLMNGDSLFDVPLRSLMDLEVGENWVGKIALRRVEDASRYGTVMAEGTTITRFDEKVSGGKGVVNGGIYYLNKKILNYIHDIPCSIETDVFPVLAKLNEIYGVEYDSFFIDIGIPNDLERAQTEIPAHIIRTRAVASP